MIRTLLADNEVWICRLMESMVDWEALGYTLIGSVHDGNALLDAARELAPDLIITDIEMPGRSGLEVIRLLREEGAQFRVMILSGHDDFSYAKDALELGAFAYLLKPLDQETLEEKLCAFRDQYRTSMDREQQVSHLQERLAYTSRQYFFSFLKEALAGTPVTQTVEEVNRIFDRSFRAGSFNFLLLAVDAKIPGRTIDPKVIRYYCEAIRNALRHICFDLTHVETEPYWGIFLNYDPKQAELVSESLRELVLGTGDAMPVMMSARVVVGIGRPVETLGELTESWRAALRAVHARHMLTHDRLIDSADIPEVELLPGIEAQSKLRTYINTRATEVTAEEICDLILDQESMLYPHAPLELSTETLRLACEALPDEIKKGRAEQISALREQMQLALEQAGSFDRLREALTGCIEEVRSFNDQLAQETGEITKIRQYIDAHIGEDISLSDLAELVHYNPNYLSEYFKRETGENINRYITQQRIERAKLLLSDETLKCKEVAAMVGYRDFNYFTRVFKSTVGVTPRDYKKIFGKR